jgi:threonine dehydrogenase-like Zn-dependent dehydrogenase
MTKHGMVLRESEGKRFGPDDLLVRTIGCGVCEGDVVPYRSRAELGDRELRPGHEGIGVVDTVGETVTDFAPGDPVTCLSGAYAEYFTCPARMAVKIPDGLDPKLALGEPLACIVHAMNRLTVGPGDAVAVVGCGFMGMLCIQVLKHRGAGRILAIDVIDERREHALTLGADDACAPEDAPLADDPVKEGTFDIVVEAAGVQAAVDLCGDLVNHHGHMNIVATHRSNEGRRTVHMFQWNWKSITIHQGHVRRMEEKTVALHESVDLLASGAVKMDSLVRHYTLEDADQAFQDLVSRKPGVYKAVLMP